MVALRDDHRIGRLLVDFSQGSPPVFFFFFCFFFFSFFFFFFFFFFVGVAPHVHFRDNLNAVGMHLVSERVSE